MKVCIVLSKAISMKYLGEDKDTGKKKWEVSGYTEDMKGNRYDSSGNLLKQGRGVRDTTGATIILSPNATIYPPESRVNEEKEAQAASAMKPHYEREIEPVAQHLSTLGFIPKRESEAPQNGVFEHHYKYAGPKPKQGQVPYSIEGVRHSFENQFKVPYDTMNYMNNKKRGRFTFEVPHGGYTHRIHLYKSMIDAETLIKAEPGFIQRLINNFRNAQSPTKVESFKPALGVRTNIAKQGEDHVGGKVDNLPPVRETGEASFDPRKIRGSGYSVVIRQPQPVSANPTYHATFDDQSAPFNNASEEETPHLNTRQEYLLNNKFGHIGDRSKREAYTEALKTVNNNQNAGMKQMLQHAQAVVRGGGDAGHQLDTLNGRLSPEQKNWWENQVGVPVKHFLGAAQQLYGPGVNPSKYKDDPHMNAVENAFKNGDITHEHNIAGQHFTDYPHLARAYGKQAENQEKEQKQNMPKPDKPPENIMPIEREEIPLSDVHWGGDSKTKMTYGELEQLLGSLKKQYPDDDFKLEKRGNNHVLTANKGWGSSTKAVESPENEPHVDEPEDTEVPYRDFTEKPDRRVLAEYDYDNPNLPTPDDLMNLQKEHPHRDVKLEQRGNKYVITANRGSGISKAFILRMTGFGTFPVLNSSN